MHFFKSEEPIVIKIGPLFVFLIFDEETPARLIETVLPDVLVKGGDYIAEDIVGYQTVTKNGGRVEVVNYVEGKSTTGIVNLIMENA